MSETIDMFAGQPNRSAVISPCGLYRYRLDRTWDERRALVAWIMLNPSTADGSEDDPTLRRITAYSKAWDFGSLAVVNLFAWRARDPKDLRRKGIEPVGYPDADRHIADVLADAGLVVCGWGSSGPSDRTPRRIVQVMQAIERAGLEPHALAVTGAGYPRHPLYLRGDLRPRPLRELGSDDGQ